jgi:hypothetical protein
MGWHKARGKFPLRLANAFAEIATGPAKEPAQRLSDGLQPRAEVLLGRHVQILCRKRKAG